MTLLAALLGGQQVHLDIGLIRLAAHVVVAHQTIEVIGAGGSGISLVVQYIRLARKFFAKCLSDSRAVCSSGVPSGILITTCSSLLLSNGSIFTRTNPRGTSATEIRKQHATPMKNKTRLRAGLDQRRHDAAIEPGPPVLGLGFQ
jgi:hypothetical protein